MKIMWRKGLGNNRMIHMDLPKLQGCRNPECGSPVCFSSQKLVLIFPLRAGSFFYHPDLQYGEII